MLRWQRGAPTSREATGPSGGAKTRLNYHHWTTLGIPAPSHPMTVRRRKEPMERRRLERKSSGGKMEQTLIADDGQTAAERGLVFCLASRSSRTSAQKKFDFHISAEDDSWFFRLMQL